MVPPPIPPSDVHLAFFMKRGEKKNGTFCFVQKHLEDKRYHPLFFFLSFLVRRRQKKKRIKRTKKIDKRTDTSQMQARFPKIAKQIAVKGSIPEVVHTILFLHFFFFFFFFSPKKTTFTLLLTEKRGGGKGGVILLSRVKPSEHTHFTSENHIRDRWREKKNTKKRVLKKERKRKKTHFCTFWTRKKFTVLMISWALLKLFGGGGVGGAVGGGRRHRCTRTREQHKIKRLK